MAQAIVQLLQQPGLAQRLTQSARQRVLDAFTPELQARTMLGVYQQVAKRRPAG
jgi:hypothetical protein